MSPVCKVAEVAELLDCSRWWVYDRIARHQIPVVEVGRAKRVPRVWVEQYIAGEVRLEVAS